MALRWSRSVSVQSKTPDPLLLTSWLSPCMVDTAVKAESERTVGLSHLLLLVLLNDSKTRAQEQIPRVSTGFLASPEDRYNMKTPFGRPDPGKNPQSFQLI
ncbi:unnamed protein product [Boreogadus saida]